MGLAGRLRGELDRGVGCCFTWLVFLVLLLPVRLLFLLAGVVALVFMVWRRLFLAPAVIAVSLACFLMGYPVVALVLLAGLVFVYTVSRRQVLVSVGLLLAGLVTYFALGDASSAGYVGGLRGSIGSSGSTGVLGFHLVILVTVFVLAVAWTGWFDGSRIAGYLRENPHGFPAILFMALLLAAAVYLARGDEGFANVLAELAYYSLVVSVSLAIPLLGEDEEGGGG